MEENMGKVPLFQKWILFYVMPILNYSILQIEVSHSKTAVYHQHSLKIWEFFAP